MLIYLLLGSNAYNSNWLCSGQFCFVRERACVCARFFCIPLKYSVSFVSCTLYMYSVCVCVCYVILFFKNIMMYVHVGNGN